MPSALELDAAILCGGLGTRLHAAVPGVPKCLAPVRGRPFLERLLRQLQDAGCRRVVLCTGVGAEAVRAFCASGEWAAELVFSHESSPLGTGGALGLARTQLHTGAVVVLNGDSMVPGLDWAALVRAARPRAGTVVVTPRSGRGDTGAMLLDAAGRVRSFAEKPAAAAAAAYDSAGIYVLAQQLLAEIPTGAPSSLERDWLPHWIGTGLYGYVHPGPMFDIGTPERWAQAQDALA